MTIQYRKITGEGIKYIKWAEVKVGEVVLDGAKFELLKEGKFGPNLHFATKEGTKVVPCSGLLKYLLENKKLNVGDKVRLVYKGKKSIKGGRTAHDFDIEIAESDDQQTLGF